MSLSRRLASAMLLVAFWLLASDSVAFNADGVGRHDTLRFVGPSGTVQFVYMYLPPDYRPDQKYPLLYLLHGFHGNQYAWEMKGGVSRQLDSLIAAGCIEPVVVAMPYCIPYDTVQAYGVRSMGYNVFRYHHLLKGKTEKHFSEVMQVVASRYAVDTLRQAIAGLSYGARVAANVSKDTHFDYVGLFSPVLNCRKLPADSASRAVYFLSVGLKDGLFLPCGRRARRRLLRAGMSCSYHELNSGHDWDNWCVALPMFLGEWIPARP